MNVGSAQTQDRAARSRRNGPLPVADYMALCLFDPEDGYYTTREPFGAAGDFITAPEISQMFGELVGVWLYSAWRRSAGRCRSPSPRSGPAAAR